MPRHLYAIDGRRARDRAKPERELDAPDTAGFSAAPREQRIAVVIAERHAPMRQTLRALIEAEHDLVLAADTADLALAETAARRAPPPVLVLDAALVADPLPGSVAELRARVWPVPVVVLLTDVLPSLAERVLRAGASGVVLKERADAELADAVRTAAKGEAFFSIMLRAPLGRAAGFHGHDDGVLRISRFRQAT
jgi:DNA-binding NarL/FixJ family response regulator